MKTLRQINLLLLSFWALSMNAQLSAPEAPQGIGSLFATQNIELAQPASDIIPTPAILPSGLPVYSAGSGPWTSGLNWDCGCAPSLIHEVHILNGHTIEMYQNQVVESIYIEEGGSLVIIPEAEVNTSLTIFNSFVNNGTLDAAEAELIVNGTQNTHYISGQNLFSVVNFQSAGEVILEGPLSVLERVDLVSTQLSSNGNLKLIQGNEDFHGLATFFNSSIEGAISLERTFVLPSDQYFNIAPGVSGASFEEWNDDLTTTGFPGSDFPATTFQSIVRYDETQSDEANSYIAPGNVNDLIDPTQGYYVYSNDGSYVIDILGEAVHGAQHYNLTLTTQENSRLEGFHFLGNPFAATIERSMDEGWVRQSLAAAIHQWDYPTEQFGAYVNGIGVNGSTGRIPMMGTFWMKALEDGASLQLNENAKGSSDALVEAEENAVLRMSVSGFSQSDEIAFALAENTSANYDPEWDAQKLFSSNVVAELAWEAEEFPLAIQRTEPTLENQSFPVLLTVKAAGNYVLSLSNQLELSQTLCMSLEDVLTETFYPIESLLEFNFDSDVVTEQERFILHFGSAVQSMSTMVTCANDFDGELTVQGTGDGPWDYIWMNSDGLVIREMIDAAGSDTNHNLAPGNYTVIIGPNDLCPSLEIELSVEAPPSISFQSNYENIGCGEDESGSIEVEINGGVPPYSYNWSQGSTGNMLFNLPGGTYTLLLGDSNGCELEYDFVISEAPDVTASFDYSDANIALINGQAVVEFTNTSQGENDITWDFGDGNQMNNINNPVHVFTEPGIYIVSLLASNDECSDQYSVVIQVEASVGVEEFFEDQLSIFPSDEGWLIETDWAKSANTEIDIYNLLGQQLIPTWKGRLGKDRLNLKSELSTGATIIQLRRPNDQWIHTVKRVR